MSQLMFWNKQNNSNNNSNNNNNNNNSNNNSKDSNNLNSNGSTADAKNNKRNWLHTPDALTNGHVVYLVKFFGNLPVEQAKGIEVVKDAIRKLQFAQQMKKAETGTQEKFKKVEITISVDGVAIQEPRTQKILHQFPLHNISYCADEKGIKKFFSFIAKNVKSVNGNGSSGSGSGNNSTGGSSSSNSEDTHECFVFISNKLASDITLTIGQAFDLAYKKYMSSTEKNDLGKAQQQIIEMEKTITLYRNRLREISMKVPKSELDAMLFKLGIQDITDVPSSISSGNTTISDGTPLTNGQCANNDKLLIDTDSMNSNKFGNTVPSAFAPIVPPRSNLPSQIMHKSSSQKMDELLLNSDSDSDFDPRADESITDGNKTDVNDIFGFEPTKNPLGQQQQQQLFFNNNDNKLQNKNNNSNNNNNNNNNSTLVSHHSFTNEMNLTPPLLAPPPKAAAPRRTISTSSNSNNISGSLTNGNTDLFGSDPFDTSGANIFKGKLSSVSVDDFSLESLDPLRK